MFVSRKGGHDIVGKDGILATLGKSRSGPASGAKRRYFVGALGAVVVLVAVLLLFAVGVVGCGGGGGSSTESIMTFATAFAANESMDPNKDQYGFTTDENVYERLVSYNALTNKYNPQLATSWDISSDGLTWTFHLRNGVKFQDGTAFDSAAVKFSYDLAAKGGVAYHLVMVDSIATPDASTVVFKLKYGYPLLYSLCWTPFIVSPTAVNKLGDNAYQPGGNAGTGPYMLKTVNTTVETTMTRNPNYWGGWSGDHAKCPQIAIIRSITEPATRVQNLEQGVVQLIDPTPETDVDRVNSTGKFKVVVTPTANQLAAHLNCQLAPTDDQNFRLALYYAMPYEDICKLGVGGYATAMSGFIASPFPGYDKQVSAMGTNKQDMAKAKEYLAKSKYPNGGVTVSCSTDNASPEGMRAMELYKTALAELNVTLDVQPLDIGVIFQDAMSDKPTKNMVVIGEPGLADGVGTLEMDLQSGSAYNLSKWKNDDIDKLIADAYAIMTNDPGKATDMLIQADKIAMEQMPIILVCNNDDLPAVSTKIKGFAGFTDPDFMIPHFYEYSMEQ